MRLHTRLTLAGTVVLGCFLLVLPAGTATDGVGSVLPDDEYARLIAPTVQAIQNALEGTPNRRAADKARVAAVMLAEFAQQNLQGSDAVQRATVRDAALAVAGLVRDKRFAEAVKQAQKLPALPANPNAKKEKVKLLGSHFDIEDLMSPFRATGAGGLGIEAKLDKLLESKDEQVPAAALTDQLRLLALQTAVAGGMLRDHMPDMKAKEWEALAGRMSRSAVALAEAAKTKDGKSAFAAVTRLSESCNQCHLVFRK